MENSKELLPQGRDVFVSEGSAARETSGLARQESLDDISEIVLRFTVQDNPRLLPQSFSDFA